MSGVMCGACGEWRNREADGSVGVCKSQECERAAHLATVEAERDRLRAEAAVLVEQRRIALDRVASERAAADKSIGALVDLLWRCHPIIADTVGGYRDHRELAEEIVTTIDGYGNGDRHPVTPIAERLELAETRAANAEKYRRSGELELEGLRAAYQALENAVGGPEPAARAAALEKEAADLESSLEDLRLRVARVDAAAEAVRGDPENVALSERFSEAFAAMRRAAGIVG